LGVDDSKPVIKAQTNENDGEATPPSGKTNKVTNCFINYLSFLILHCVDRLNQVLQIRKP